MIRPRFNIRYLAMLALIIGASACSKEAPKAGEETEVPTAEAVAPLFASGFADAGREAKEAVADRETGYDPDPDVRRKINGVIADNLRRNFSMDFVMPDPEQFLRSGAAGDIADRKLEALGLPTNDVASATVLMFGLAWELANQQKLPPQRQMALLKEVDRKMAEKPIRKSQRQTEADIRLLTAAMWMEEARLRQGSPDQMQALSDAVQRDMKRMSGNDMRAHDITDAGFVER